MNEIESKKKTKPNLKLGIPPQKIAKISKHYDEMNYCYLNETISN